MASKIITSRDSIVSEGLRQSFVFKLFVAAITTMLVSPVLLGLNLLAGVVFGVSLPLWGAFVAGAPIGLSYFFIGSEPTAEKI